MKKAVLLVLTGIALAGCINITVADTGRATSQTRGLAAFDKVHASRGIEVTLYCGPVPSVVLRGEERDVADTEISVENGELTARRASMMGGYHRTVHAEVTAPGPVVKLTAGSGATLEAPACLVTHDRLELESSSGASIRLAGQVRRLVADTGSGSAIRPAAGGRIDAEEAEIESGSGSVVHLCKVGRLKASASSGATITAESIQSGDTSAGSGGSISMRACD